MMHEPEGLIESRLRCLGAGNLEVNRAKRLVTNVRLMVRVHGGFVCPGTRRPACSSGEKEERKKGNGDGARSSWMCDICHGSLPAVTGSLNTRQKQETLF
jgi:hypothetical protein